MKTSAVLIASAIALSACQAGEAEGVPGDPADTRPYADIAEDTVLRLTGTEPFWGATISDGMLIWTTPENIDGTSVPVDRFAGRGGLSFSGELDGAALDIAITPGTCSDGMSDRTYPFHATVKIGGDQFSGCAWREGEDELGEA